jgi:hypothetical protein
LTERFPDRAPIVPSNARNSAWQFIGLFIIAVFVSVIIQQDFLLRHFHSSPEKVAVAIASPRSELGDNYYYLGAIRRTPQLFRNAARAVIEPGGGPEKPEIEIGAVYLGALSVGYLLHSLSEALTPASRDAVQLTLILQTTLAVFAFLVALLSLIRDRARLGLFGWFVVGLASAVFLTAFSISTYLGRPYLHYHRLLYYPEILRLVNPTLFWAWALFWLYFFLRFLEERTALQGVVVFMMALPAAFFGIGVTATLAGAMALFGLLDWIATKRFPMICAALTAVLGVSLLLAFWVLQLFHATSIGSDIQTGSYQKLEMRWHFLLLLLLVIPLARAIPGPPGRFMCSLVVISALIGLVSDSFHLGDRLWLRGGAIFAWLAVVFLLTRVVSNAGERLISSIGHEWKRLVRSFASISIRLVFVAAGVLFVNRSLAPDMATWRGFIDRDKWELLTWIDRNTAPGAVIASSNIEDSYLLPLYTRADSYVALYAMTPRGVDVIVSRYFQVLAETRAREPTFENLLTVTDATISESYAEALASTTGPLEYNKYQRVAFYTGLLYYPFNRRFQGILAPGPERERFVEYLRGSSSKAAMKPPRYDFLILRHADGPGGVAQGNEVFRNATYSLRRQVLRSR